MKLIFEAHGQQHIIITDNDDHNIGEMVDFFARLMLSAGFGYDCVMQSMNLIEEEPDANL